MTGYSRYVEGMCKTFPPRGTGLYLLCSVLFLRFLNSASCRKETNDLPELGAMQKKSHEVIEREQKPTKSVLHMTPSLTRFIACYV